MRSSDTHYYVPDQLYIWRNRNNSWAGDGKFRDLKAKIVDVGWYYEQKHCEFAVEADARCVYIKVIKADPDTDFTRTIGVKISWEDGRLRFPVPSIGWEEPHNDSHRINSDTIQTYFDEDGDDFKNNDGTYNIDAIVEKLWSYYKGKETLNYWGDEDWQWMSGTDFRKKICGVWDKVPKLLKNYVERKLNDDRG